ncbi:MAG: 50S ribosomal protein L16 [Candidatus Parcubacteria bacterium]|nr:MAG: 50S ribosomal protein L16 [Candidatus Parcubacteria bacterium]
MLQPKKLKYRKRQKGRSLNRKIATKGNFLVHGEAGLRSLEAKIIYDKEIESAMNELRRRLGKKGRYWLRIFPHLPKTKKPPETRMGGGKGDVDAYVTFVKPGSIIFEASGLDIDTLKEALRKAAYKLSIKTQVITKT